MKKLSDIPWEDIYVGMQVRSHTGKYGRIAKKWAQPDRFDSDWVSITWDDGSESANWLSWMGEVQVFTPGITRREAKLLVEGKRDTDGNLYIGNVIGPVERFPKEIMFHNYIWSLEMVEVGEEGYTRATYVNPE